MKCSSIGYVLFVALFTVPLIAGGIYTTAAVAASHIEARQTVAEADVSGHRVAGEDQAGWERTALLICPLH